MDCSHYTLCTVLFEQVYLIMLNIMACNPFSFFPREFSVLCVKGYPQACAWEKSYTLNGLFEKSPKPWLIVKVKRSSFETEVHSEAPLCPLWVGDSRTNSDLSHRPLRRCFEIEVRTFWPSKNFGLPSTLTSIIMQNIRMVQGFLHLFLKDAMPIEYEVRKTVQDGG